MNSNAIKMILDQHNVNDSENLANALAKVLDEFSKDRRVASNLSKSIDEDKRIKDRIHGIL